MDSNSESKDHGAVWKYVTKLEKIASGTYRFQCNLCQSTHTGSHTRVKAHLLGETRKGVGICTNMTNEILDFIKKEIDEDEVSRRQIEPITMIFPPPPPPPSVPPLRTTLNRVWDLYKLKQRRVGESDTLELGGDTLELGGVRDTYDLDSEISRMFYSTGLPLHFAKNPFFIRSFSYVAVNGGYNYLPPTANSLKTTLLKKEKAHIERKLQPFKDTWMVKGVIIVSTGWSDYQSRHLINFMAVNETSVMFLKAVDTSKEVDNQFLFNALKDVIYEVGTENVVQVVVDDSLTFEAAKQLIGTAFPKILWTPCVVHMLNLSLDKLFPENNAQEDDGLGWIGTTNDGLGWIGTIVVDITRIKQFITNHPMGPTVRDMFTSLYLLCVAETRFASKIVMLRRFKRVKRDIQALVISSVWKCYSEGDIGMATFVRGKVLGDDWWHSIDYIIAFTSPIYDMLRECDTDKPSLHLVYDQWNLITRKVKEVTYAYERKSVDEKSTFSNVVQKILADQWRESNTLTFILAHSFNPSCYNHQWLSEDPTRVLPHEDKTVTSEKIEGFVSYFCDPMELQTALVDYSKFCTKKGSYAEVISIEDRWNKDPRSWWAFYGASMPIIQNLAIKLFGKPSSSSFIEKNWKTYSFVSSMRESQMTLEQAKDMLFVHNNLRLLSKKTPEYLQGPSKMWDIAGDVFGSFDDVGVLDVANLSLDEPELDFMLITEDK